jgi:ribose transport system substrate-binding protein
MISKNALRAGLSAGVAVMATLALTVGTATSSQAAGNTKVIGVSIADQKSLFYIAAADGMKQAAKAAGYKLVLLSADNDSSKQVNQVQNLLSQKVGVMIYTPQDNTAATAGVKLANKAKVPVVALDQKPESAGAKIQTFIATDSVKAAYTVCSWLFKQFNNSGEIAILQGPLGATAEVQRTAGCKKALSENPNVKDVAWQTAGWDETQAFNASQNILTAHPNLKAIFGESDAMALGAAKAAKQAGRAGMFFAGIDGFPTMFTAIQDGLTQGTMAQQPYMMGQLAVKNAISILQGKSKGIPALQYQDAVLVNKGNVASNNPAKFYGPNAAK